MCTVCEKAEKLPLDQALKLVADAMKRRRPPECLDQLIGKLIGTTEGERDLSVEAEWERRRG